MMHYSSTTLKTYYHINYFYVEDTTAYLTFLNEKAYIPPQMIKLDALSNLSP